MEIDPSPVPPPQEYSDNPAIPYQSESSMNFDYLHSLHADSAMDSSNSVGSSSRIQGVNSPRHFAGVGANSASSSTTNYGQVDDSRVVDRFVTVLDQLDARVEKFRKDALGLQEKPEREEISCYIQRVNSRLSTVELNVRTVRDQSQEDSLSQINVLIDMMITMGDPVLSRQRCQMYLNACCSARESGNLPSCNESGLDMDAGPIDKKFESVLLGCTLDDQKNIKKRLQALMGYLNKQIIHH
ncbi:BAG family molecular chaperone regulator 2 [Lucilia cuprina]|nr:BAG family molecular chaperone regulator 2 [Lucilia cuprina]